MFGAVADEKTDAIVDTELDGTGAGNVDERAVDVDAGSGDTVVSCPPAQHLAFACSEDEDASSGFERKQLAEQVDLGVRQRVQDAFSGLRDLGVLEDVDQQRSLSGHEHTDNRGRPACASDAGFWSAVELLAPGSSAA